MKINSNILLIVLLAGTHLNLNAGDYFKKDKVLFDFHAPFWIQKPNGIKSEPQKSFAFSFAWGIDKKIGKSDFSYFYGVGYSYHKLESNLNLRLPVNADAHPSDFKLLPVASDFDFNKLKYRTIEIPLELRYRTSTKVPFRIYFGGKVGYVFSSSYESQIAGEVYSRKKLTELNHFQYGLTLRVGAGLINGFVYYGLNDPFNTSAPSTMKQLSIGLSFLAN